MMTPDVQTIRHDALMAAGVDLMTMRFRVVEYEKSTGELIGVAIENAGFRDAVEETQAMIREKAASHFCLEPVGFIQ
jgi:Cu/Ag efflux protein CusF